MAEATQSVNSPRPCTRTCLRLLLTSLFALPAYAQPTPIPRTIASIREAHDLSNEVAAHALPVHLRGTVTYYDPANDPDHISLFFHDHTGTMFAAVPKTFLLPLPAGTRIDMRGVTGVGRFAPIIKNPEITVLGKAPLPRPASITYNHLIDGSADGQWVIVRGVVRSVYKDEHDVTLQLALPGGVIGAVSPIQSGIDYDALTDATIDLKANAAPLFNDAMQMIGARLLFPNMAAVKILEPPSPDPFQQPVTVIESLSRFNPQGASTHRVHLRGQVTLYWPGALLCIRDASRGLCANTLQTTPLPLNAFVDVIGFTATGSGVPILNSAAYRQLGTTLGPPQPPLQDATYLRLMSDAELVRIDGELIGTSLAADQTTLLLAKGDFVFTAILPKELGEEALTWDRGSRLRITGICSASIDTERSARATGTVIPKSFRILLRTMDDVTVLRRPSWWSPRHALWTVGLVLAVTTLALGWIIVLRKRVEHQTEVIRHSEERFRYLAQHDTLTGLPTRMLLSERLDAALHVSRQNNRLALLMLDIDDFKRINDTHGHHGGDEALRVTAQRLKDSVRQTDTVARMGGDEFVVLLTAVGDTQATAIAAKIVATLSQPITVLGEQIAISVSVGLCKVCDGPADAQTLLKRVDTAMYRAKARGKNCFHIDAPELPPQLAAQPTAQNGLEPTLAALSPT